jgi:phage terminase large subunit-like protein
MMAMHPAKLKVIAAGRRFGKTILGGVISLAAASQGARVAWITPTYKNGRPLWRWAESAVAPLRSSNLVDVSRSERVISFPSSGGFLGLYSADSEDSVRGEAFHVVVLDEAARIAEETWNASIQPTLADYGGDAILISTPKGRNWFWREFTSADGKRSAAFTAPSSDNPNPRIKRAAILAKDRVSERIYRQEWLAEFVSDGGGVFRRVADAATGTPQERPIDGHQYIVGVDWGRSVDYTVFSIADLTTREIVYIDRSNHVEYAMQRGRLGALYERFHPITIIPEFNSIGEPIIEQLRRDGLPVQPFITTNASKAAIIDGLALAFERGDIRIIPDPTLVSELQAYEAERLPSGLTRYSAPEGMHDDCVMATALAWYGANQSPRGVWFA